MFENGKKLKEIKKRIKATTYEVDADGNAVINMKVTDSTSFLSPFYVDKPEINSEASDYLDNAAKVLPIGKEITLRVFCDNLSKCEETTCASAIKNYYSNRLSETDIKAKKNAALYYFMGIFGVLLSFLLFFISKLAISQIILELLTILSWVFVWEAIDLFVFDRPLLRYELKRSLSFVTAKVEFLPTHSSPACNNEIQRY